MSRKIKFFKGVWPLLVVKDKIATYVDRYAYIDKGNNIRYSFYDNTHRNSDGTLGKAFKRVIKREEAIKIFNEIYA